VLLLLRELALNKDPRGVYKTCHCHKGLLIGNQFVQSWLVVSRFFGSFTLNFYASGADKLLSPTKGRAP
jgi:hypothetical protein